MNKTVEYNLGDAVVFPTGTKIVTSKTYDYLSKEVSYSFIDVAQHGNATMPTSVSSPFNIQKFQIQNIPKPNFDAGPTLTELSTTLALLGIELSFEVIHKIASNDSNFALSMTVDRRRLDILRDIVSEGKIAQDKRTIAPKGPDEPTPEFSKELLDKASEL